MNKNEDIEKKESIAEKARIKAEYRKIMSVSGGSNKVRPKLIGRKLQGNCL